MTVYGLDEAWEPHPDSKTAAADGFRVIFRYLSHDSAKNITAQEAAAIHAAGAAVGFVWETTADRAGHGSDAGAADVRDAEAEADAVGAPLDAAIYYAVDYDPDPSEVVAYFEAVRAAAKRPVGAYCSDAVAVELFKRKLIDFFWQTESTGFRGRWPSPIANVRQHTAYERPKLSGDYDEDVIVTPDVGQWPRPVKPSTATNEEETLFVRDPQDSKIYLVTGQGLVYIDSPAHLQQLTGAKNAGDRSMVRTPDATNPIWKLPKVS